MIPPDRAPGICSPSGHPHGQGDSCRPPGRRASISSVSDSADSADVCANLSVSVPRAHGLICRLWSTARGRRGARRWSGATAPAPRLGEEAPHHVAQPVPVLGPGRRLVALQVLGRDHARGPQQQADGGGVGRREQVVGEAADALWRGHAHGDVEHVASELGGIGQLEPPPVSTSPAGSRWALAFSLSSSPIFSKSSRMRASTISVTSDLRAGRATPSSTISTAASASGRACPRRPPSRTAS